jgi:hypothetical protein
LENRRESSVLEVKLSEMTFTFASDSKIL